MTNLTTIFKASIKSISVKLEECTYFMCNRYFAFSFINECMLTIITTLLFMTNWTRLNKRSSGIRVSLQAIRQEWQWGRVEDREGVGN